MVFLAISLGFGPVVRKSRSHAGRCGAVRRKYNLTARTGHNSLPLGLSLTFGRAGIVNDRSEDPEMKGLESLPQNLERRQKTLHPRPSNEIHGTKERGALQCAWRRQEL